MMEFGPIAVSVDASSWSHYSGGVLDYDSCGTDIDHAVLLVGELELFIVDVVVRARKRRGG